MSRRNADIAPPPRPTAACTADTWPRPSSPCSPCPPPELLLMFPDRRHDAANDEHFVIVRGLWPDIRIIALDLVAAVRVRPDPLHHADVSDRYRPDLVLFVDPLASQVDDHDRAV